MKTIYKKLLLLLVILPFSVLAQSGLSGIVTDKTTKQPLPGVNVVIQGSSTGTQTDFDGKFQLPKLKVGDKVLVSYIGYKNQTITYNSQKEVSIALEEESNQLQEVVVQVGYGNVKKKDATGSVAVITTKDFNKGPVVAVDQMVQGKVAGLQVTSAGGSPGEGGIIRIRGGASLTANNDPLYVIDNVPVEKNGVEGGKNPLATINQNNIESVTVLKDASATAIYGSRASNGVIIITTKKGKSGEMQVNYNANASVSTISKQADVLTAEEFRNYVNTYGNAKQKALLGTANTDWQKEVFRTAYGTDQNIALSGGNDLLTYRASLGFTDMNGLLKKDNFLRNTVGANLVGNFFDKHLHIEVNNNTSSMKNNYSEKGAIGSAISYDPTQPVYNPDGTYFQWYNSNLTANTLAGKNPVGLLNNKNNFGNAFNSVGNIQAEYKLHFFPDLKLVANLGYEFRSGRSFGNTASDYYLNSEKGDSYIKTESKKNRLMDLFFNYKKDLKFLDGYVELTSGYSYQNFKREYSNEDYDAATAITKVGVVTPEIVNLQSYFGRLSLNIQNKYLLTGTLRRDGTSRFDPANRWGNFPSVAFAWKMNEENILKDSKTINNLKLRLGWGITGQQDVTVYPSIPLYLASDTAAQYQIGNTFYTTYRPQPYNASLKWEETETINAGLDFALFNNVLTGAIDVYQKNTSDLLAKVPNPAFFGFSNYDNYNVGKIRNKGVELSSEIKIIRNDKLNWSVGGNLTVQESKITGLIPGSSSVGLQAGDAIDGGVDNHVQINQVGYTPNSFYVYEQIYNSNGKPIDGAFVDRNGDGKVNSEDLYIYKKPTPDLYYGLYTNLTYNKWDFSMTWRGSINNYVYNNVDSNKGWQNQILIRDTDLSNGVSEVLNTNLNYKGSERFLSDYYIQNASFIKLDNMTFGYNFNKFLGYDASSRVSLGGQNLLIITKYKGIDPELEKGLDKSIYPRPLMVTLGLNVNF